MLNQIVLVGRIKKIKKVKNEEKKMCEIILAVPRSWKNNNGEYEIDFIECTIFGNIAESTIEYCKIGDIIGIKGRMAKLENDKNMKIITEKVTFLSTRKEDEE